MSAAVTARYDYRRWDGTRSGWRPRPRRAAGRADRRPAGRRRPRRRAAPAAAQRDADGGRGAGPGPARAAWSGCAGAGPSCSSEVTPTAGRRVPRPLDEVEDDERGAVDALEEEARASGDERRTARSPTTSWPSARIALDLLPGDVAGPRRADCSTTTSSPPRPASSSSSCWRSSPRGGRHLLRGHVGGPRLDPDPEQLARMRDAFDALNRMLEQRERGEPLDPTFEEFMEQFGDLFGPAPPPSTSCSSSWRARMAAAEAMWRVALPRAARPAPGAWPSPCSRTWTCVGRSSGWPATSQRAFPECRLGPAATGSTATARWACRGDRLPRLSWASSSGSRTCSSSATSPAALPEIDLDEVRRHLGEDAARSLDRLARLTRELAEAGLIENRGGRTELTPKGVRRLGQRALSRPVLHDAHGPDRRAQGHAGRAPATTARRRRKPYEYGDPFNLHLPRTVHNAVRRAGAGVPVRLAPEDFEVVETEALARSATVLLVDLSMSMPMRDNFVPAKKMAMALQTLISSRFPRDYLGIVGFSEVAREIKPEDLPTAMWDYVYGTNLQHALLLARKLLAHQHGTKQIIVVTDGEPTAHIDDRRRGLLQLPADARDAAADHGRGGALHPGRDHHQHVRPRPRADPVPLRRADRPDQRRADLLPPRPTRSGATCWWTSSGTAGCCDPRAELSPPGHPDSAPPRVGTPTPPRPCCPPPRALLVRRCTCDSLLRFRYE